MKTTSDSQFDSMKKILTDSSKEDSASCDPTDLLPNKSLPPSLSTSPETAADDLVKLVLAVIDTVRQVMEKQAIRRVESGALAEAEIERLGLTLMRLEARMVELKSHFGLSNEDLNLHFGTVQDLKDILNDEE
ncbi:gas vesicle protein GvpK [Octadecabacter antarcticus 307]|uniref:Gas vesicle protein GvpK n=1 Tax=Octadecabacter antarcticus 307 TaxID=391626 RepID=M9R9U7_9RHOB|nr:gas vesicle protein K [Octadecabacter antarcticus]AGI68588.1 gas vesicle protein GvpK [Octadecabacter antarcticus 307]